MKRKIKKLKRKKMPMIKNKKTEADCLRTEVSGQFAGLAATNLQTVRSEASGQTVHKFYIKNN